MVKKLQTKLLLLLAIMLGGAGTAWAEKTATLTVSKVEKSNITLTDDQQNEWTFTTDGKLTSNNTYIQAGTNSASVSYVKLTTSGFSAATITKVQVWGTSKANTEVTAKVIIGTTTIGTSSAYTSQNASSGGTEFSVENTNGVTGDLTIEISRPSSANGAIYFNKAIVTYEEAGGSEKSDHGLSWSANSAGVTYGSEPYNLPTLNNENNLTVTYGSSDASVATIDQNGIVTVNNVNGKTTISATFSGDDTYRSGIVSYELTVTKLVVIEDGVFDFDNDYEALIPSLTGVSSNGSDAGNITENVDVVAGNVTLTLTAAEEGTANRIWSGSPRLRLYSGTHTFSVPEGYVITSVNISQGKWNSDNTFNGVKSSNSNWTGAAQTVELGIAGNTQIKTITVKYSSTTATITSAGMATWVAPVNVEVPQGVTASIVTAIGETATLAELLAIPAGTPVILQGEEGQYTFSVCSDEELEANEADVNDNLLQVSDGETAVGDNILVLANGDNGPGFYLWAGTKSLSAGRVYMVDASGTRTFIGLGEATGIEQLSTAGQQTRVYFDLQGRRVSQPAKGLYIVNGKKVVK